MSNRRLVLMRPTAIPSLLVAYFSRTSSFVPANAQDIATSTHLDVVNTDIDFRECSQKNGKEWHICTWPASLAPLWYCPAYSDYNEAELEKVNWLGAGDYPVMPCFTCPAVDSSCSAAVSEVLAASNITRDQYSPMRPWINIWDQAQEFCETLCESSEEGESCNDEGGVRCEPGFSFCDYEAGDTADGTCKACPEDLDECFNAGFAVSVKGRHNCLNCRLLCAAGGVSTMRIDEQEIVPQAVLFAIQSSHQSASGPLHDCSNLSSESESTCSGAEGKMCIVEFTEMSPSTAVPWQVSDRAEKSGCVGVVMFGAIYGSHDQSELSIPYVSISVEEGQKILSDKIGVSAEVHVNYFGVACSLYGEYGDVCSARWPCMDGYYCEYHNIPDENGLYTEGLCKSCPADAEGGTDPVGCFFNIQQGYADNSPVKKTQNVKSCAETCDAKITGERSKFGTAEVNFDFDLNMSPDDRCAFCPNEDILHPNRTVPMFGGYTCRELDEFFKAVLSSEESRNCQLAHSLNYICGCEGTGYAGANTHTKRAVLAWLPRIAAILSILGSFFIIYDTLSKHTRRKKFLNQLLSTIGVFDIIGSVAYVLTTLPIPKEMFQYGVEGNENTCIVQGFIMQIGTIACYLSASLSMYYLLTIKYGWNDDKLRKRKAVYYLYIPPVLFGFVFAFVGIRFYDDVTVWCSFSAQWWPEIPVIISIVATTLIMGNVCWFVYSKEKRTAQYTGGGTRISMMVFKQAVWFVSAFYVTWGPYLMLQYMWSSGTGYNKYGLILTGATLVPLQGFWNCMVYCRPRYFSRRRRATSRQTSRQTSAVSRCCGAVSFTARLFRRRNNQDSTPPGLKPVQEPTENIHQPQSIVIATKCKLDVVNAQDEVPCHELRDERDEYCLSARGIHRPPPNDSEVVDEA